MRTKPLLLTASALLLLAISGCTAWRVAESVQLVRHIEPLQVRPPAPAMRLLVVGDSTAVGTGASAPQASLVGLLVSRFPDLLIENRAATVPRLPMWRRSLPALTWAGSTWCW